MLRHPPPRDAAGLRGIRCGDHRLRQLCPGGTRPAGHAVGSLHDHPRGGGQGTLLPRPGRTLGELASPPRLLYHGRVDRRKGVFELLDAYQKLRHAGRVLRLTVSGIGPDYQETRDRAAGIDGDHVGGHVDYFEAPARYREHDLFVSPTHAEGFSNTILEAMASGLPIVSCHAVGVVDCLTHGRNGRLARVADVEDLVAQIQALLDDRDPRHGWPRLRWRTWKSITPGPRSRGGSRRSTRGSSGPTRPRGLPLRRWTCATPSPAAFAPSRTCFESWTSKLPRPGLSVMWRDMCLKI